MVPHKKLHVVQRGHGSQHEEYQNKVNGIKTFRCLSYSGDHCRRDFPSHQSGRPHIYSSQEAQTVGDVGQSIPWIYAAADKRQVDHEAYIIIRKCLLNK